MDMMPASLRAACVAAVAVGLGLACARADDPAPPTRRILYQSQAPGGTEDIRLLDPESGSSTVVVSGDSTSARNLAAWSPDSRRIAFVRGYEELHVLDSIGGLPRRIGLDLPAAVVFPDWSPDGTRLAVSAGDKVDHPGVYIVDVASGRSRRLRSDSSAYRCPTWSPEGDRLVVAAYRDAATALIIIDTSGAALDTVAHSDSTYLDCPQWSPRGDEVLFTVAHGGGKSGWERPAFHTNLAVVSLSTRAVSQLTRDRGLTNYGRWARDGDGIVFQSDRHAAPTTDEAGVAQMLQNLEIWTIRRDGSGLRRLTTNSWFDAHPSW
jgi:Tol biopolymer transport system component